MQTFSIRRFVGIRNSVETSDQQRGALRKAEGLLLTPSGAVTGGPRWSAWSGVLGTYISSALTGTGAAADKVHFVRYTKNGGEFLIAWDLAANRDRGIFYLGAYGTVPEFGSVGGGLIEAPTASEWRNKSAGLRWYGSWINGRLWLGNGTDLNLVWNGALGVLGPASLPADIDVQSKYRFPPCKQWVMTADKVVYGAGNVTNPLRVWATERSTALAPALDGIYSADTSFVTVNHTRATRVTAISVAGPSLIAHTDAGTVVISGFEQGSDGYKAQQSPTKATEGALNPNCTADADGTISYFLSRDRQLYRNSSSTSAGYQQRANTDAAIATSYAGNLWNADMSTNQADDFAIFQSRPQGLIFLLAPLAAGGSGFYCYNEPSGDQSSIVGPIRYPDLTSCTLITGNGTTVLMGMTRDGVMIGTNLSALAETDSWDTYPPDTSTYRALDAQPAFYNGAFDPIFGVKSEVKAEAFFQSLPTYDIGMSGPFAPWVDYAPACDQWFRGASVAIIEFANEDFGSPTVIKEFCQLRLQFAQNSLAYVGVFAESEGKRYGRWKGTAYPRQEQLFGLKLVGRRLTVRILIVYWNDLSFLLRGVDVDVLPTVAN